MNIASTGFSVDHAGTCARRRRDRCAPAGSSFWCRCWRQPASALDRHSLAAVASAQSNVLGAVESVGSPHLTAGPSPARDRDSLGPPDSAAPAVDCGGPGIEVVAAGHASEQAPHGDVIAEWRVNGATNIDTADRTQVQIRPCTHAPVDEGFDYPDVEEQPQFPGSAGDQPR